MNKKTETLQRIVIDTLWMARRYADGRRTSSPTTVNKAIDELNQLGIRIPPDPTLLDANYARDGGFGFWRDGKFTLEPHGTTFEPQETSFEVAAGLLPLAGKTLSKEAWDSWTKEQREAACDWAGATHLRASDNDVDVPPTPEWVETLANYNGVDIDEISSLLNT